MPPTSNERVNHRRSFTRPCDSKITEGIDVASKRKTKRLRVVHPDCAGIDVGKRKHYVAVDPARCEDPVRNFGPFTIDLEALANWLTECEVKIVAMESTGVYWIALYEILDRHGFEVHLVNPRATKHGQRPKERRAGL